MPRGRLRLLTGMAAVALLAAMAWQYLATRSRVSMAGRVALGAHALVAQEEGRAPAVARTPLLDSAERGSRLVAFVAGHASNRDGPTDNFGNDWRPFGAPVAYRGYAGRFDVRAYLAEDARGGTGHIVSVAKPGQPAGELTLAVVEVRHASRLVDASRAYPAAGWHLSGPSVRTDGPALLVAFWWGDSSELDHHAWPGDGFRVIERVTRLPPHSAVQGVVAVREVQRAGQYAVTWYNLPRQGAALWLFAFADGRPPAGGARPLPRTAARTAD